MIADLIFDLGFHNGDDTAYYLHRDFKVVAVEANPILVAAGRTRFEEEIADSRLQLLGVGVGDDPAGSTFWVNELKSDWSSFDKERGCRRGTPCHPVEVPVRTLSAVLEDHGTPYYMKIDVEGRELHCLRSLDPDDLPQFISVEMSGLEILSEAARLGYSQFKIVDQRHHNSPQIAERPNASVAARFRRIESAMSLRLPGRRWLKRTYRRFVPAAPLWEPGDDAEAEWVFPQGCSGPFGTDLHGEWLDLDEAAYEWLHHRYGHYRRGTLSPGGWFDLHARRPQGEG
ncbi:MAG: FkbM family methyltransferase [Acidimicrobiia bacterium]|nr:FkbM family methyltransferase [Acidimicrobiia bacterium]